jgi:molybdopterin molybdotransferase
MISETEALERVLTAVDPGPVESVPLAEADGRWLRESLAATVPLPSFDNSAMDGYAISASDCGQTDRWLEIIGEVAAGQAPSLHENTALRAGAAMRVFTGAPVPEGTGAVVMQEDTELSANGQSVRITDAATPGDFVRRRGSDLCSGQRLIGDGEALTPAKIGLLASQGHALVRVGRQPTLLVLTTGDELIAPGEPLPHHAAIYNSNGPMIAALARRCGAQTTGAATVKDALEAMTDRLRSAIAAYDLIVITGGVSVGKHDHVKPALERLGIKAELWRVAIKPGKPFLFARAGGKLIFGLPGNPVSACVTFVVFVGPAVRRWQGAASNHLAARTVPATLAESVRNEGDRPHYLRGLLDAAGTFHLTGVQESHALFALSQADALLRLTPNTCLDAGALVPVLLL